MTVLSTAIEASRRFMDTAERLPVLWKLSLEFTDLIDLLESEDADEETIELELKRVAGDIERKADGVAAVVGALESLSSYQDAEAKRIAERSKRNKAHADRLRAYALKCMRMIGVERLETGRHTLAIKQNPAAVNVLDESAVPSEFNRTRIFIEPDRVAIKAHFKATGEVVPGTEIVRGERLSIS